jgi:DNA-binding MarR family transcriptional regulator
MNARLAPFDLTHGHWVILSCLWQEQGTPVSEIASKVQQIGGTLAGVLDRIEKRKLIKRKRDRKDRRVWRVWLTDDGERLLEILPPIAKQVWDLAWSGVSDEDRLRFSSLINQTLATCCPEYNPAPAPSERQLPQPIQQLLPPYSLGYRMKLLAMMISRIFTEKAAAYKVTPSHWIVLCRLWQEDGLAISEIGRYLEQVGGTLAGVLERMEERGFIFRKQDERDRRSFRIWLTPAGSALLDVLPSIANDVLNHVCTGLSNQEVEFLEQMLDKILLNLQEAEKR